MSEQKLTLAERDVAIAIFQSTFPGVAVRLQPEEMQKAAAECAAAIAAGVIALRAEPSAVVPNDPEAEFWPRFTAAGASSTEPGTSSAEG